MNLWHVVEDKLGYQLLRSDRDWRVKCNDLAMAHDLCDLLNATRSYGSPSYQRQSSTHDSSSGSQPASSTAR